jgi:hypothetical protein
MSIKKLEKAIDVINNQEKLSLNDKRLRRELKNLVAIGTSTGTDVHSMMDKTMTENVNKLIGQKTGGLIGSKLVNSLYKGIT